MDILCFFCFSLVCILAKKIESTYPGYLGCKTQDMFKHWGPGSYVLHTIDISLQKFPRQGEILANLISFKRNIYSRDIQYNAAS